MKQTVHLIITTLLLSVFSGGCERLSQQANQRKDIILTRTEQTYVKLSSELAVSRAERSNGP